MGWTTEVYEKLYCNYPDKRGQMSLHDYGLLKGETMAINALWRQRFAIDLSPQELYNYLGKLNPIMVRGFGERGPGNARRALCKLFPEIDPGVDLLDDHWNCLVTTAINGMIQTQGKLATASMLRELAKELDS